MAPPADLRPSSHALTWDAKRKEQRDSSDSNDSEESLCSWDAKRKEQRDSSESLESGLTLTNIRVLPSPPRQGARRWVSLEFR